MALDQNCLQGEEDAGKLQTFELPSNQTDQFPRRNLQAQDMLPPNLNMILQTPCKFCYQYFQTEDMLRQHLKSEHGKDYLKVCSLCGKYFFSAFGYSNHINIVHTTLESGPQCNVCGKFFTCRSKLSIHMKCHSEERDIQCPKCLKSFKHKYSLTNHACK